MNVPENTNGLDRCFMNTIHGAMFSLTCFSNDTMDPECISSFIVLVKKRDR